LNEPVCLFCNLCKYFARKRLECNLAQSKRCMVVVDDAHSIYDGNEWKTMKMDKLSLLVMLTCRIKKDFAQKNHVGGSKDMTQTNLWLCGHEIDAQEEKQKCTLSTYPTFFC
jgi:hypothetical protein